MENPLNRAWHQISTKEVSAYLFSAAEWEVDVSHWRVTQLLPIKRIQEQGFQSKAGTQKNNLTSVAFCSLGGVKRKKYQRSRGNLSPLVVLPGAYQHCSHHCPWSFPRCHCKECQRTGWGGTDDKLDRQGSPNMPAGFPSGSRICPARLSTFTSKVSLSNPE